MSSEAVRHHSWQAGLLQLQFLVVGQQSDVVIRKAEFEPCEPTASDTQGDEVAEDRKNVLTFLNSDSSIPQRIWRSFPTECMYFSQAFPQLQHLSLKHLNLWEPLQEHNELVWRSPGHRLSLPLYLKGNTHMPWAAPLSISPGVWTVH